MDRLGYWCFITVLYLEKVRGAKVWADLVLTNIVPQ